MSRATKANKELLAALDELEALPKGEAVFVERVTALRKLLQQHLRDERQELLPAVENALSDEEVDAVASDRLHISLLDRGAFFGHGRFGGFN